MNEELARYTPNLCCLLLMTMLSACSTARAPVTARGDTGAVPVVAPESHPAVSAASGSAVTVHVVVKGDTLYSIAWRYGQDYRDLGRWNGIADPYLIIPGQRLSLIAREVAQASVPQTRQPAIAPAPPVPVPAPRASIAKPGISSAPIRWQWPTSGRVIESDTPTAKKGLEITGAQGQAVTAAAAGAVVYSGSGLLGYGRLIILKHSDTFLSAYAYNERLLVAEGDQVASGQQIATMGLGNSGRPVLHFEIRKDGKPVNPLQHLPRSPPTDRS